MMEMILLHSRQVMDPQEILRTSKASQGPLTKNWTGITMVSLTRYVSATRTEQGLETVSASLHGRSAVDGFGGVLF